MTRFSSLLFFLLASILLQGNASPVQPRDGPLRFRPRVDVSPGNASFPIGNATSTIIGTEVSSLPTQTSSLSLTSTSESTSVSSTEASTSSSEVSLTTIESSTSTDPTISSTEIPSNTSSTSTTETSSTSVSIESSTSGSTTTSSTSEETSSSVSVSIEPSASRLTSTSSTSEETSSSSSTSLTSEVTSTTSSSTTNPNPLTSITWSGSWSVSETPTTTAIWSFFPVPTTTIAPAEATQQAILLADLFFALRFNRQWITDPKLKSQYIENLDKTKDEVVALFNALDVKPPPKPDCSSTKKRRHLSEKKVRAALANRDLFGAIGDLINDVAGLITCATKIVDNLIDNVKLPVPPIIVIEKLTDALSKIGDDLKDPEDPNDPSTTDQPTSTQSTTTSSSSESSSCTGVTAFPVCTQTVSLSTSFFSDATSFTVETVTSTACVTSTVTGCASGTTTTTSVSSTTSAAPACSPECGSCSKGGTVTDPGADDSEVGEVTVPKKRTALPKEFEKRTMVEAGTDVDGFYNTILNDEAYKKSQVQHRSSGTKSSAVFRDFEGSPFGLFVDGLFGCTSVTVVSEKGAWMSHFWEAPGFRDGTSLDDFKKNILGPMSTQESINLMRPPGSDRSLPPPTAPAGLMPALFPLLAEGQKLGPETPREIFIQSPHADGDITAWMYPERVQLVIDLLTGPGQPLAGVTVTTKKYEKFIGTDLEKDPFYFMARTHVFLQYDNNQVAGTETAKQKAMWRIWLEDEPHQHDWDATDLQLGSCPLNKRKRDGSCSRPTLSAFEGGTEIPTATSGPTSSAIETTSATSEVITTSLEPSTTTSETSITTPTPEPSTTIPPTSTAITVPTPTTDPSFKPTCNDPTTSLLSPIDFAISRSTDFCQQALSQSTISTTPKYSTTYPHDGLGTGVDVYFKVEWEDVFPGVGLCLGSLSDLIGGCTGGTSRDEQTMGGSVGNGTVIFTVTPTDKIIVD